MFTVVLLKTLVLRSSLVKDKTILSLNMVKHQIIVKGFPLLGDS